MKQETEPRAGSVAFEAKKTEIIVFRADELTPFHHFHNHIEMIYKISGSATAVADDNRIVMEAGDLFWTFPNQIHHYTEIMHGESLVLLCPEQYCADYLPVLRHYAPQSPLIPRFGENARLMSLLGQLEAALPAVPYGEQIAKGYLNVLIGELLSVSVLQPIHSDDSDSIRIVVNYCSQNYKNKLTLELLEHDLHINKYHISHLFTNKLKISFNNYINMLRITNACELLRAETPITETALLSGFSSIRSFNRAFVRYMEQTPRDYCKKFASPDKEVTAPHV